MVTKALRRLLAAALMASVLVACSDDSSTSSGDGTPSSASSPSSGATTGNDAACAALSNVKSSAATLKTDLQAKNFGTARTDVGVLESAVNDLVTALQSGAQQGTADLTSAWDNVKTTFQGLDKSDVGTMKATMAPSVDQLKTTLESLTSSLSCS